MDILKPVRLTHLKTQAAFLLKDVRSALPGSKEAATQFLKLPAFSGKTFQWILDHADAIKLKDALLVVAMESGFKSWLDLKKHVTKQDCLYRQPHIGLIYAWFNNYESAANYHKQHGGFLISFWKDFAICGNEYISCLSLFEYPDQWKSIGYDWVKPADHAAWEFLNQKAINNYLEQK